MQAPTYSFWKIINWLILYIQVLISIIGLSGHLVFGKGLGDIFLWLIIIIAIIMHLTLTLVYKNKTNIIIVLSIIFSIFTLYISLKATIWRDIEYTWNGKIFYNY